MILSIFEKSIYSDTYGHMETHPDIFGWDEINNECILSADCVL